MRYYDIILSGGNRWTSHPYGAVPADPGAQEVLLNLQVVNFTNDADHMQASTDNNSTVEIKGVPWDLVKSSNSLIGQHITIKGGMMPGLPLATIQSANAGILVTGKVSQCWGNWIGTEMSIGMALTVSADGIGSSSSPDGTQSSSQSNSNSNAPATSQFQVANARSINRTPFPRGLVTAPTALTDTVLQAAQSAASAANSVYSALTGAASVNYGGIISSIIGGGFPGLAMPLNLIHDWQPNTPLMQAIQKTLSTAFPSAKLVINISPQLMLQYQDAGVYQNINQYAAYLYKISRAILGAQYYGVHISSHNDTIYVSDKPAQSITLTAYDFIGQPTWIKPNVIEAKVVMRGNVVPQYTQVTIPAGTLLNVSQGAIIPLGTNVPQVTHITMEGMTGLCVQVNHIGDFRNPDGNYWCTVIQIQVFNAPMFNTAPDGTPLTNPATSPPDGSGGAATSGGDSSGDTPPSTNNDTSQSQQIPHITIPLTPGNVSPPSSQSVLAQQRRMLNRPIRRVLH